VAVRCQCWLRIINDSNILQQFPKGLLTQLWRQSEPVNGYAYTCLYENKNNNKNNRTIIFSELKLKI